MIRDQERLSGQLIGFAQAQGPMSASSVASDDSTEVSSLGSAHHTIDGSASSFGIRGSQLAEDEFDDEELTNIDLSYYRT